MEAEVVLPSRSTFRKPSHTTSQRNYRRRSPSSASRSPSHSSSPPRQASSGGWKRERSAPSSPQRGGATNSSLHSKKGRRGNEGSDEDSQGRYGDPGPASSERQVRGASHDRYGKPDFHESKRSGSYVHERSYGSSHGRYSGRDSYSDSRRNGDYDYSGRARQNPERGYRDSGRSRDKERRRSRDRDIEGYAKHRSGGRETNLERDPEFEGKTGRDDKERDRDRDKDRRKERGGERDRERDRDREREKLRDRDRERSRGRRSAGRDSYYEKSEGAERRYDGGSKSRESKRDRDRERDRVKSKSTVREAGEIDSDWSREKERGKSREKWKERDAAEKRQSKSGEREVTNPTKHLDTEGMEWSGEKLKEEGELNGGMDMETEEKDTLERTREGGIYPHRERTSDTGGRELRGMEIDGEKDLERSRDTGRGTRAGRGGDRSRERNGSESPDRPKDRRDQRKQEDGDEDEERSVHIEAHRKRDWLNEKDERCGYRSEKERSVNKGSGHSADRDRDIGRGSSGNDRRTIDAPSSKEKPEKGKQQSTRVKDVDGSYNSETRDGEGVKSRKYSAHQGSSLHTSANDSETKVTSGSDERVAKNSKWGPEASDSAAKSSASDELANDLTAAKLAAMKAAELVNKNLGVAGFMSADQKKRLLWGSKKVATEQPMSNQEPVATAAGVNRWDTVHFSDPDRQEKFHKLMGVKSDTCLESKKEGEPDVSAFTEERQRELQQDLEKQFAAGLRRRDGGKVGLGL